MKDKILMIAVAASAGYAGGKLGAAQVGTPDYLYAKEAVIVGERNGSKKTMIGDDGISITGRRGIRGPVVSLKVNNLSGKEEAHLIMSGGDEGDAPGAVIRAGEESVAAVVGLLEKNHIWIGYEHGSQSTIERVLTGGRSRKLVAD